MKLYGLYSGNELMYVDTVGETTMDWCDKCNYHLDILSNGGQHENELYTEYSSLSEARVQAGATVNQGDVIGVSGVCEYDSSLQSHVYFKVMTKSKTYNPEDAIGKTILEVTK